MGKEVPNGRLLTPNVCCRGICSGFFIFSFSTCDVYREGRRGIVEE